MIIIKYNALASYSKQVHDYFDDYIEHHNPGYRLRYPSEELGVFKEAPLDSVIRYNNNNPSKIYYLKMVEDIKELIPNTLDNLIKKINDKAVFLVIIPNFERRLKSLVFRKVVRHVNNIEDVLLQNFKAHCGYSQQDIPHDHITFNKIILISDLEELVQLHTSGKIKLICISENSVDKPELYFKEAGLDVDGVKFKNRNKRMNHVITVEKLNFINNFLKNNSYIIENRYQEIYKLLEENNIKVV